MNYPTAKVISFGKRKKEELFPNHSFSNPGPGQYNQKSEKSGSAWKIGTDAKYKTISNETPGVGSYELKLSSTTQGCQFPKAHRETNDFLELESDTLPGPGQYAPNLKASVKNASSYR